MLAGECSECEKNKKTKLRSELRTVVSMEMREMHESKTKTKNEQTGKPTLHEFVSLFTFEQATQPVNLYFRLGERSKTIQKSIDRQGQT